MHEHIGIHDVVRDTFAAIVQDVNFHVGQKQLHAFLSSMLNSSYWWVDIMLTKDGMCTLANVVIADPMWTNLILQSCTIQKSFASNVVQTKEMNHCV
jgi:hypothetical protein